MRLPEVVVIEFHYEPNAGRSWYWIRPGEHGFTPWSTFDQAVAAVTEAGNAGELSKTDEGHGHA
jgi:hypothetical protein